MNTTEELNVMTDVEVESQPLSVPEVSKTPREEHFKEVASTIMILKVELSGLYAKLKLLERAVNKEVKTLNKAASRNKNKGNRKPSGFAKSSKISEGLCTFMNKPAGSEVARTEVTKYVINYIKEHNLQRPENKKFINPDEHLKTLLEVPEGDDLSYFNIQKYMNKHFV
jgi:chromatin remodeling complex protein RSC6